MPPAYRVYVLQNTAGRFYIGLSEDVAARLTQHNAGESRWTAKFRPWTLVWQSSELDLSDARKLENLLKRQKGGDGLFRMTGLKRRVPEGSYSRARGIVGPATAGSNPCTQFEALPLLGRAFCLP